MNTTLTGSLTVAPAVATETAVPGGVSVAEFASARILNAQTGLIVRVLNSAGALTALEGPGVTVAGATFLYMRTTGPMEIEITQNGTARLIELSGLCIIEADPANPITLLRAKGVGTIEYFAGGPT